MNTNRGFSIVFKVALIIGIVLAYSVFISAAPSRVSGTSSNAPRAEITLVLDDGHHEEITGITNTNGTARQFLWLNRFTPDPALFPFYLHEIWVLFDGSGSAFNLHAGDAIELVIYLDIDTNLANGAMLLAAFPETIQVVDGDKWSQYQLPMPVPLTTPGDVIIGVINRYTIDGVSERTYPAACDTTLNQGRSWWGWWEGAVPEPPLLPPDTFGQHAGNWMIRAYGSADVTGETGTPTQTSTSRPWTSTPTHITRTLTQSPTPTRTQVARGQFLSIIIHQIPPTFTPTPTLPPTHTPTATPALANVYIDNDTGGRLCYEVVNSGIGRKCSSEANFFYGSFKPGTYTWKASARCGGASGTRYYSSGDITHKFWCIGALQNLP